MSVGSVGAAIVVGDWESQSQGAWTNKVQDQGEGPQSVEISRAKVTEGNRMPTGMKFP